MNQKVIAVLVILLMFAAFLFVTPKGRVFREKYIDGHIGVVGNFFKGITSRVVKGGSATKEGEKLAITIASIPILDLNGLAFPIKDSGFVGDLHYDYASFAGGTVSLPSNILSVNIPVMTGNVAFSSDRLQVAGKTSQLTLNGLNFNTTSTDFAIVGVPISFQLNDIQQDKIVFSDISGSLSWTGLKGIPPLLADDNLELYDFQGFITMQNGKIMISGFVSKMRLNGVNIGS